MGQLSANSAPFLQRPSAAGRLRLKSGDLRIGLAVMRQYELVEVIDKYKELWARDQIMRRYLNFEDMPRDTRGSIEVLEFVAAHLNVLDLHACSRIEGKQTSNEISWDLLCVPVRIWCPEFSLGVFLEFFQEWLTFAQPINVNR